MLFVEVEIIWDDSSVQFMCEFLFSALMESLCTLIVGTRATGSWGLCWYALWLFLDNL